MQLFGVDNQIILKKLSGVYFATYVEDVKQIKICSNNPFKLIKHSLRTVNEPCQNSP